MSQKDMCRKSAFVADEFEINEEQVGFLEVYFDEQLGYFLVQLADVVLHVVHRDFVLVRLFQICAEDLPPVP